MPMATATHDAASSMSRLRATCGVVLLVLGIAGCADGGIQAPGYDPTMPPTGAALFTLPTESGAWQAAIWTFPQPPAKGQSDVLYRVTDSAGGAVDDLTLTVVPWMPAHGHGTSIAPIVTSDRDGRYLATPVNLYMAGRWELHTTISRDTASDNVVFAIDVR